MLKLFEKITVGSLTLHNRIVMPPMATLFGNHGGTVSSRLLAYYGRRSKGGVGLIIVENTAVHPGGVNYPGTLEIHSDRFEDGLARLASSIKGGGAIPAIQLFHPGRQIHPKYAGNYPIAPSAVPCPVMGGAPRVLEADEIRDLVNCFVNGAQRAKDVGFEAVEIHGAHGYLVAQFLSPFSNRRNDRYGGDAQRRARFAVEIIEGIRERLGDSFPVFLRISADEKVEGGLTIELTRELITHIERAGVTALHVSAGCYPSMEWVVQPYLQPNGCLVHLAAAIRDITDIPIITVGRINDPGHAESILEEGAADLISMGRALMADPDLPNKAKEGRFEEIRPCVACNVCIKVVGREQTRCAVNPEVGREDESPATVGTPRRVMIVGGGPGGMQTAITAYSLGHKVKLVDKREVLGGQLILAGVPDSKADLRKLLDYYRYRIGRSGIDVELAGQTDLDAVNEFHPDHIIMATGSVPRELNFVEGDRTGGVIQAFDILREGMKLDGDVVIVGGGLVGLDTAEFLANQGANVTIMEMGKRVGRDLEWNLRKMRIENLKRMGIKIFTETKVLRVEEGYVVFTDPEGTEHTLEADMVVLAVGSSPYNPLKGALQDMSCGATYIGDCKEPRGLAEAIAEGFQAALDLSK